MVHFVLVHGVGHGGWCWYKIKPMLESAGHQVTAVDLAASGINMAKIDEVHTMADYTEPLMELMDSLSPGEKVTLVGHSLGGFNLALAMDRFPDQISAAVFLTAFMPDSTHSPSYVLDQRIRRFPGSAAVDWLDSQFSSDPDAVNPKTTMLFGPKFLASNLYQLSSSQVRKNRAGSMVNLDLEEGKIPGGISVEIPVRNEMVVGAIPVESYPATSGSTGDPFPTTSGSDRVRKKRSRVRTRRGFLGANIYSQRESESSFSNSNFADFVPTFVCQLPTTSVHLRAFSDCGQPASSGQTTSYAVGSDPLQSLHSPNCFNALGDPSSCQFIPSISNPA
ncbi:hypothetical protein NE237_019143 [Protea cynaroides]|uniref:AB hydrolase-1 domain-containing protein n=1 Tax=Protea cynaroides TaxID=273540 RepID=A0A9Q0KBB6_9MAGN|nr:hypothetical protein NE237_019143 [Protea cynaroides]